MKFVDTYNAIVGMMVTVLAAIFGQYWFIFAMFLMFNVVDWLTGWHKANKLKKESSTKGLNGILKKIGYWVIILIGFSIPMCLMPLGDIIGVDLKFLNLLGWFILANLTINEVRSIIENLYEVGYKIPQFLIKGLAIADLMVNTSGESKIPAKNKEI